MRWLSILLLLCLSNVAVAQFIDCNNNRVPDEDDILGGVSLDCNSNGVPDECECLWDNGAPAADIEEINGHISHIGGGAMGMGFDALRVADDVILPPGYLHRVMAFRGVMLTNSLAPARRAKLCIFEDCNGQPAEEPFFTSTNFDVTELGLRSDLNYVVEYRFDLCEDQLWLLGGKAYWFSLVGVTDNVTDDLSSWAFTVPSDNALLIKLPVAAEGQKISHQTYEYGPWSSICTACPDCVNMVFDLDGYSCPILHDNGRPDLGIATRGGVRSGPHSSIIWRSRDDFVLRLCEDRAVCVIDLWVWANCDPMHGFIELYSDDPCAPKDGPPATTESAIPPLYGPVSPTLVVDVGEEYLEPGTTEPLRLYMMRLVEPGWTLTAGRTYWVSGGAAYTGSFNTRSLFAFANRCPMPCDFMLNAPQQRRVNPLPLDWSNIAPPDRHDLAFRIAVAPEPPVPASNTAAPPPCPADFDGDGIYDVPDIFTYLSEWFAGCP